MKKTTKAQSFDYPDQFMSTFGASPVFFKDQPPENGTYPRLAYHVESQSVLRSWRVVSLGGKTVTKYEAGTLLNAANAFNAGESGEGFIFYGQRQKLFCLEPVPTGKLVERVAIELDPKRPDDEIIRNYEMYLDASGRLWKRGSSLVDLKFWHWSPLNEDAHQTSKTLTKEALLGS